MWWSAQDKLRLVVEASGLSENELGEFLRRKGLHAAHLEDWRAAAEQALTAPAKMRRPKKSPEAKRIKALGRELNRKDKALAEVTALLAPKDGRRWPQGTAGEQADGVLGRAL